MAKGTVLWILYLACSGHPLKNILKSLYTTCRLPRCSMSIQPTTTSSKIIRASTSTVVEPGILQSVWRHVHVCSWSDVHTLLYSVSPLTSAIPCTARHSAFYPEDRTGNRQKKIPLMQRSNSERYVTINGPYGFASLRFAVHVICTDKAAKHIYTGKDAILHQQMRALLQLRYRRNDIVTCTVSYSRVLFLLHFKLLHQLLGRGLELETGDKREKK